MRIMDKLEVVRIEVGISVSKIKCWLLIDTKYVQACECRLLPNLEFS